MVVRRGINERAIVPMARWARDDGLILRFIEYMDVGHTNGWRMDDVVPADELVAASTRSCRSSRSAALPRRGRDALALPRRQRRDRADRVGHAAVLRRLHPRPISAEGSSTPACSRPRPRPRAILRDRLPATRRPTRRRGAVAAIWRVRDDRYSELRTERDPSALPRIEMFAMGG
jgi:cyclic pyranopterin phosphate synthase